MNFRMITLNQYIKAEQNYSTWILTALLFILKLKIFTKTNYDENDKRLLPRGKNKNVICLFKYQLGGKITKEFVTLRVKAYAYLKDDDSEHKKAKGTKKCVIKRRLLFEII